MYILVIQGGCDKRMLIANGAPDDVSIKTIRTPISRNTSNGFGEGGTAFSTAMRAAFFTKKWIPNNKPFFYVISESARPAVTALRKSGKKSRVFTQNGAAMRKAFMLCDMFMYSTCFNNRFWLDGRDITDKQLRYLTQSREDSDAEFIEKLYDFGYDGLNFTREARILYETHLDVPLSDVVTANIGAGAMYTTKLGAHVIDLATKVPV